MSSQYFVSRDYCPGCKSTTFSSLYNQSYTCPPISDYLNAFYSPQGGVDFDYLQGASYQLLSCGDCSMVFQREVPGETLMDILYEQWIDPRQVFLQHQSKDGLKKYTNYAQEVATIIASFNAVPTTLKFLDFGMGWGSWALMAKAMGCQSYGAELSQERMDYAASNGINVVSWDEIAVGEFDFINTEQVFEHLSEPLQTLLHLKKGLNKNGILKISVPTARNIDKRLEKMDWRAGGKSKYSLNAVAPLEHINYFKMPSLLAMADVAGMEPIDIPSKCQHLFTTRNKGFGHLLKEWVAPKKRNKNYLFLRIKP